MFFIWILLLAAQAFADPEDVAFREKFRAVPTDSEAGRAFDEYCRDAIKLLDPKADEHGLDRTTFILLADHDQQAFHMVKTEKVFGLTTEVHAIGISLGELRTYAFTEDFLWVLGHEWFHRMVHAPDRHNSKAEEALADAAPLTALARVGRNPNRALEYARTQFSAERQSDVRGNIKGEWILDVHPLDHHRLKAMSQFIGKLSFDYGGFNDIAPQPLDPLILSLQKKPRYPLHVSYLDRFLPPDLWSTLDTESRLIKLRDFLNTQYAPIDFRRRDDLRTLIDEMLRDALTATDPDLERSKIYQFVQSDLIPRYDDNKSYEHVIFNTIRRSPLFDGGNKETFLYGPAAYELRELAKRFVESANETEALATAAALVDFAEAQNMPQGLVTAIWTHDVLENFDFPDLDDFETRRRAAKRGKVKLPRVSWYKHVAWAFRDSDNTIFRALKILGIAESRLRENRRFQNATKNTLSLSQGPHSSAYDSRELVVNDEGRVDDVLDADGEARHAPIVIEKSDVVVSEFQVGEKFREQYVQEMEKYHRQARHLINTYLETGKFKEGKNIKRITVESIQDHQVEEDEAFHTALNIQEILESGYFGAQAEETGTFADKNLFIQHPHVYAQAYELPFAFLHLTPMTSPEEGGRYVPPIELEQDVTKLFDALLAKGDPAQAKNFLNDFFARKGNFTSVLIGPAVFGYLPEIQDTESPLISFLLEHHDKFLSKAEVIEVIEKWDILGFRTYRTKLVLKFLRDRYAYKAAASENEMIALLKKFYARKINKGFFQSMATNELYEWMEASILARPSVPFVTQVITIIGPDELGKYPYIATKFREVVGEITAYPSDLKTLLPMWRAFHDAELFPYDGEAEKAVIQSLLEKISELDDPKEVIKIYSEILSSKKPVAHPTARHEIIQKLAEAMLTVYGIDDSSFAYQQKITPQINSMVNTFHSTVVVDSLEELADNIEAQAGLAREIQTKVIAAYTSAKNTATVHERSIVGEWLLLQLSKNVRRRKDLVQFLASAGGPADCQRFGNVINQYLESRRDQLSGKDVVYTEYDLESMARSQYNNFWALGFVGRVALLDNFLFPESTGVPREQQLELDREMLEFAVDLAFPESASYHQEAREFLYAYLPGLEASQRGLFMASLLGGARRSMELNIDARLMVGMQLAQVLNYMGPIETKLAQTIHSHPDTPSDIRDGMSESKSKANPPSVLERHEIIKSVVPEHIRQGMHVGSIQGSASFYVVLDVTMNDGRELVLKLLRPHSGKRMETGFNRLKIMIEGLREKLSHSTYLTLQDIIEHSKILARSEVDGKNATETHQGLREIYDAELEDLAKNKILKSRVVDVIDSGDGWALLEKAPGVDYAQMSLEERQTYAGVLSFQAFAVILRGDRIDTDRHGGQFRIFENQITHFDPGGVTLEKPSDAELAYTGKVIFEILQNASELNYEKLPDISGIIAKHLRKLRDAGEASSYLQSVQKALLASQDYLRLLKPKELRNVLTSVAQSGMIHPKIIEGMGEGLMAVPPEKLQEMQQGLEETLAGAACYKIFKAAL